MSDSRGQSSVGSCETRSGIEKRWSSRREEYARFRVQVDGAKIVDEFLADLQKVRETENEELLSLGVAAQISGYSRDHLARLIRQGTVVNSGRKNRPLVKRKHLPKRAISSLARGVGSRYDPTADARSLMSRQGER